METVTVDRACGRSQESGRVLPDKTEGSVRIRW